MIPHLRVPKTWKTQAPIFRDTIPTRIIFGPLEPHISKFSTPNIQNASMKIFIIPLLMLKSYTMTYLPKMLAKPKKNTIFRTSEIFFTKYLKRFSVFIFTLFRTSQKFIL